MTDAATSGPLLVHGTCVALGGQGALLRGASGAGKSDLALRFLSACAAGAGPPDAVLVADDQVHLTLDGGRLTARPPAAIAGRMEVRGVGIVTLPHAGEAEIVLVVELTARRQVPRLPPAPLPTTVLLGVDVPVLKLDAFEASAPLKLALALRARMKKT